MLDNFAYYVFFVYGVLGELLPMRGLYRQNGFFSKNQRKKKVGFGCPSHSRPSNVFISGFSIEIKTCCGVLSNFAHFSFLIYKRLKVTSKLAVHNIFFCRLPF